MTYDQFYEGQRVGFFSDHEDRNIYGEVIEVAKNPQRVYILWDGNEFETKYGPWYLSHIFDATDLHERKKIYSRSN